MDAFPHERAVMIGRGLLRNPALVREIQGGPALTPDELFAFFREVQKGYEEEMYGDAPVLAKMKELWSLVVRGRSFPGSRQSIKKDKESQIDLGIRDGIKQVKRRAAALSEVRIMYSRRYLQMAAIYYADPTNAAATVFQRVC